MRNDYWTLPPGTRRSPRRVAKTLLGSFLVGALSIGMAWAGAGLVPAGDLTNAGHVTGSQRSDNLLQDPGSEGDGPQASTTAALEPLQDNQIYAGAHKVNIAPQPERYGGEWRKEGCTAFKAGPLGVTDPRNSDPTDFRVRWFEGSNCIYAGGFDLGPANAVASFDDEYGLWARATAISDGNDTVVLMILDGAYYFAKYNSMCNDNPDHASAYDGDGPGANKYTQDCGFRDLQTSLAEKYGYTEGGSRGSFGLEPSSFFLASSHAHASPDFVGAWGGVPRWYMQQVEDAIREAVYGAIDSMQPTYLEASEYLYRGGNGSRRRHYHAAEEAGYSWMRFTTEQDADPVCTTPAPQPWPTDLPPGQDKKHPSPAPTPTCTQPPPDRNAIATIGTYAAHPTASANNRAYADIAGVYAKRAEERFGGVGLFFQTGFGNMTAQGGRAEIARDLVSFLPDLGEGPQVTGNLDVRTTMRTFDQPVTNSALGGGGVSGIFDRPMETRPSAVSISKESMRPGEEIQEGKPQDEHMPYKRCNSASPITVNSQVSAARIGSPNGGLLITGGPGELLANLTNTVKEKNAGGITFPLSLVNDGLGYIMQSFETDHVGRQAVGFVNGPLSEYEDAYSIDACFGDQVLEQTLIAMNQIR